MQGMPRAGAALCCALLSSVVTVVNASSIPGQFAVSPVGAATYTIPVQVPPGVGGMEPKLTIGYSSQSGKGTMGPGWGLSGLSAISRCPRTQAQDNLRGAVNYDLNDRYCLDGQRLILVSGSEGVSGAEYRTEIESFSKITAHGSAGNGPAYFLVKTKAGLTLEYGNTADSRIEAGQGGSTAIAWAINRSVDTRGNQITYHYSENNTNGEWYPTEARYAYNGGTSNAKVLLEYEVDPNPAPVKHYHAGKYSMSTVRLKTVAVLAGAERVREYRLAYSAIDSLGEYKLTSITQCGLGGAECLPATTAAWGGSAVAPAQRGSTSTGYVDGGGWNSGHRYFQMDVNGDGKGDLVIRGANGVLNTHLSNGNTFSLAGSVSTGYSDDQAWNEGHRFFPMDVNGDGRTDLVARDGAGTFTTWLSNGTTLVNAGATSTGYIDDEGWNSGLRYFTMDVNGDGRGDLVVRGGNGVFNTHLSNGTTFVFSGSVSTGYSDEEAWNEGHRFFQMDVNGDGKTDLVARGGSGTFISWLSNGTTFVNAGSTTSGYTDGGGWNSGQRYFQMDVNGDGLGDLVMRDANGGLNTHLSNGTTFVFAGSTTTGYSDAAGWGGGQRYFPMDVNADGRTDMIVRADSGAFIVWLSNGHVFVNAGSTPSGFTHAGGWGEGLRYFPMDADGDGKGDLVMRASNGTFLTWGFGDSIQNCVTSITPGLGASWGVTYNTLPKLLGARYFKESSPAYPKASLVPAMTVVSDVYVSDGVGGTRGTNYWYSTAVFDYNGRGFEGFSWVRTQDTGSLLVAQTNYRQDFPYTGMPSVSYSWTPSFTLLSQTQHSYGCVQAGAAATLPAPPAYPAPSAPSCTPSAGQRYFPYGWTSTQESWDFNGVKLPGVSTRTWYDLWGNANAVVADTLSPANAATGYSKTTISEYYPADTTNWILGRLMRATVTSTSP